MKKRVLWTASFAVTIGLFSGCGNATLPAGSVGAGEHTLSFETGHGLYNLGSGDENATFNYLDITLNGTLKPWTYFTATECAMPAVMGETNYVLSNKRLMDDYTNHQYTYDLNGTELIWKHDADKITSVKIGSGIQAGTTIRMNGIAIGTTKSLLIDKCDANLTSTTLRHIISSVGTFYDATYSDANESNKSRYTISVIHDSNMTFQTYDFNGSNFDVNVSHMADHFPLHYSDDNQTLHITTHEENNVSDETNVTCTLSAMNVRMGSLALSCAEDTNLSDTKTSILWTTLEKAKAAKVHH